MPTTTELARAVIDRIKTGRQTASIRDASTSEINAALQKISSTLGPLPLAVRRAVKRATQKH